MKFHSNLRNFAQIVLKKQNIILSSVNGVRWLTKLKQFN